MLVETWVEECPTRQLLSQAFLLAPLHLGVSIPHLPPRS